jgi:hypothetical protein
MRIGRIARGGDDGPGRGGIFGHVVIFGSSWLFKCCEVLIVNRYIEVCGQKVNFGVG